jgi:hypothetical protein
MIPDYSTYTTADLIKALESRANPASINPDVSALLTEAARRLGIGTPREITPDEIAEAQSPAPNKA